MAEPELNAEQTNETPEQPAESKDSAEIARLKAALDKATKEAAESKRALREKQTAEEAAAAEAKEQREATERELADLRKTVAVEKSAKKVLGFVGDEAVASSVAEALYGADNADAAIAALEKAWKAKENALRQEYGKIPKPGAGSGNGSTVTREQLNAMSYPERVQFAKDNPEEYNKLMGR